MIWIGSNRVERLLAAALLAGLRGPRASRLTVLVMPMAWLLFGLVGLNLSTSPQLAGLSVLSFVILGALVALDPKRLPEWATPMRPYVRMAREGRRLSDFLDLAIRGGWGWN